MIIKIAILLLLLTAGSLANIQLSDIYTRSVQDWYSVKNIIDTVSVESAISNGIVKSSLALTITPQLYSETYTENGSVSSVGVPLDSLEIAMYFTLPTDFVAQELYLWIENEKVRGYVQDRSLARGQYEEIVDRRQDPALLSYHGNGYYSLKIFPAKSLESRKVEIQFQHTLNDSGNIINGIIPFSYKKEYSNSKVSYFTAAFSSEGSIDYTVMIPGIGSGSFRNGAPLTLSGAFPDSIDTLLIEAHDPSGDMEYTWRGKDPLDDRLNLGFFYTIDKASVELEPEPTTRIITLDMQSEFWDLYSYYKKQSECHDYSYGYYPEQDSLIPLWERAQKYAILMLRNYLREGDRFNILIGGEVLPSLLFEAPVAVSEDALLEAFNFIAEAKPDSRSNRLKLYDEALKQSGDNGLLLIVSDLYPPACEYTYSPTYELTQDGVDFGKFMDTLQTLFESSESTLFGVTDAYHLSRLFNETGGFMLASLRWDYQIYPMFVTKSSETIAIEMPELFGPMNPSGLSDLSIGIPSYMEELVFHLENNSPYFYMDGIASDAVQESDAIYPYYQQESYPLTAAMKRSSTEQFITAPVPVSISGKLHGLSFSEMLNLAYSDFTLSSDYFDVLWAFTKTEQITSGMNWYEQQEQIKEIGLNYHIVTRQTSLLALEPWMELWTDTIGSSENQSGDAVMDNASDFAEKGTAVSSIDNYSLEELFNMEVLPTVQIEKHPVSPLSVYAAGDKIRIIPGSSAGKQITLRLFNLKGQLIAQKVITPDQSVEWNMSSIAANIYLLTIETDRVVKSYKVQISK